METEDPVKESIDRNYDVRKRLEHVLDQTDADRVFVYQFKNGGNYYTGNSIQRFVNTHEVTTEGISTEINEEKFYQVSNFSNFLSQLVNKGHVCVENTDDLEFQNWRKLMKSQGNHSFAVVPIHNIAGLIIGMLGYAHVKAHKLDCGDNLPLMKREANVIAGSLDGHEFSHPANEPWYKFGS